MKKLTALFLALVMALGCACGGAAFADEAAASPAPAAPAPAETPAVQIPEGADEQIQLIFSQFGSLRQDDTDSRWSYAVTDLDHDGRLEFLAAAIQGEGRFTTARAWRVKADRTGIEELTIVKGDAKCISIAAASILAKVSRDRYMLELDAQYPEYQFAKHKGYPTKDHYAAIEQYGITPYHRKSFTLIHRQLSLF